MVREGRPIPSLSKGVVFLPYADNGVVLGANREEVQSHLDGWMSDLRSKGLVVHEETCVFSC